MVYFAVYRSFATLPQEASPDISAILQQSLRNNPVFGITGYLYFERGTFFQMIEGERRAVDALMARIARDSRHYAVEVLGRGMQPARVFPDWDMGFEKARLNGARLEGRTSTKAPTADDIICHLDQLQRTRADPRGL